MPPFVGSASARSAPGAWTLYALGALLDLAPRMDEDE
jgi:hypothetical protein